MMDDDPCMEAERADKKQKKDKRKADKHEKKERNRKERKERKERKRERKRKATSAEASSSSSSEPEHAAPVAARTILPSASYPTLSRRYASSAIIGPMRVGDEEKRLREERAARFTESAA